MSDSRRRRMSGSERREQLLGIGRALFAERGLDGTSVEEIAAEAKVSKPVVYEHFGGKEGLYAVVVDREMDRLLAQVTTALTTRVDYRRKLELGALALLEYIEESTDGFRILVRDPHAGTGQGSFASLISDIATQVEYLLGRELDRHGYDEEFAAMYAQMLVGMIALTGQWWLDARRPRREDVAAHVVNLAWNGLARLEDRPTLDPRRRARERGRQEKAQAKAQARVDKARERAHRKAQAKAAEEIAPAET